MLRRALLPTLLIGLLAAGLVGCADETTSVTFECSGGGGVGEP